MVGIIGPALRIGSNTLTHVHERIVDQGVDTAVFE
jgi:hypothetical protein